VRVTHRERERERERDCTCKIQTGMDVTWQRCRLFRIFLVVRPYVHTQSHNRTCNYVYGPCTSTACELNTYTSDGKTWERNRDTKEKERDRSLLIIIFYKSISNLNIKVLLGFDF
jgi:hypothetical protein